MGATEKIARFIVDTSFEDIPRDVIEKAKRTALDCVGAALAGVGEPVSQTITGYVTKLGGPAQASVFGAGVKVSVADAALANGCIAHALDYDDCGVKIGHPSVLVLPAVLSLGEHLGASGKDILTAYVIGLEIEGKLALHADFKLMQARLNHQTWYGSIGAAAACAKLLKLDVEKTRMALGIAANFACGLSANHGSMAGAMAAGNACRNGVIAALMAQAGITANPNIIEAKNGFYDTLVGRRPLRRGAHGGRSGQAVLHRISGHRAKKISELLSHASSAGRSFPVVRTSTVSATRTSPKSTSAPRSAPCACSPSPNRPHPIRPSSACRTASPPRWWISR